MQTTHRPLSSYKISPSHPYRPYVMRSSPPLVQGLKKEELALWPAGWRMPLTLLLIFKVIVVLKLPVSQM